MYLTSRTLRPCQAASFFSEETEKVYFLKAARNNVTAKQGAQNDGVPLGRHTIPKREFLSSMKSALVVSFDAYPKPKKRFFERPPPWHTTLTEMHFFFSAALLFRAHGARPHRPCVRSNIWHSFLAFYLTFGSGILDGICSDMIFCHSIGHFTLASYRASIRSFSLTWALSSPVDPLRSGARRRKEEGRRSQLW